MRTLHTSRALRDRGLSVGVEIPAVDYGQKPYWMKKFARAEGLEEKVQSHLDNLGLVAKVCVFDVGMEIGVSCAGKALRLRVSDMSVAEILSAISDWCNGVATDRQVM